MKKYSVTFTTYEEYEVEAENETEALRMYSNSRYSL